MFLKTVFRSLTTELCKFGEDKYVTGLYQNEAIFEACMKEGSITIEPAAKRISGGGLYSGNWNGIDWKMFFVLEFDADFTEIGSFKGEVLTAQSSKETATISISEKERLGAYVKFGCADKAQMVMVKLAISFVSVERAKEFLNAQIPAFDYDAVKESAKLIWRDTLSVIELKTDANPCGISIEDIDRILVLLARQDAETQKQQLYHELCDVLRQNVPVIGLCFEQDVLAFDERLKGEITPSDADIFYGIENWFLTA